jgi:hypothetical protein
MNTKPLSIFEVLSEALDTISEAAYMVLIGDEEEEE